MPGQPLDAPGLGQTLQHPLPGGRQPGVRLIGYRSFDELGLAAGPVRGHHQVTSQRRGRRCPPIATHYVQAQVEPGGQTCRGEHLSVVHEEHVGIDLDQRELTLQPRCISPMRGGPTAVGNAVNETVVFSFMALFLINILATAFGVKVAP